MHMLTYVLIGEAPKCLHTYCPSLARIYLYLHARGLTELAPVQVLTCGLLQHVFILYGYVSTNLEAPNQPTNAVLKFHSHTDIPPIEHPPVILPLW